LIILIIIYRDERREKYDRALKIEKRYKDFHSSDESFSKIVENKKAFRRRERSLSPESERGLKKNENNSYKYNQANRYNDSYRFNNTYSNTMSSSNKEFKNKYKYK
jgi:hypothetical protein